MNEHLVDNVVLNFDSNSQWVLNIVLAFVMFGIALEISLNDFKAVVKSPKSVLVGVLSQFALLPLITLLLVFWLEPLPSIAMGMFMVAACPGGNVSNFMTHLAKGNTVLSISLTAVATLFSIVLTPINLQILGNLYEPTRSILKTVSLSPWEMIKLVSLLLGLPLVFGVTLNHYRKTLALRLGKIFKIISLIVFIALILVALYNNRVIFQDYIFYVWWVVILHNVVALSIGYSFASLTRLSIADRRTISIETGIQNSGLGLLLIFSFFDGLGGMALLAAFWGIWHLISGLIIAGLWASNPLSSKKMT